MACKSIQTRNEWIRTHSSASSNHWLLNAGAHHPSNVSRIHANILTYTVQPWHSVHICSLFGPSKHSRKPFPESRLRRAFPGRCGIHLQSLRNGWHVFGRFVQRSTWGHCRGHVTWVLMFNRFFLFVCRFFWCGEGLKRRGRKLRMSMVDLMISSFGSGVYIVGVWMVGSYFRQISSVHIVLSLVSYNDIALLLQWNPHVHRESWVSTPTNTW